MKYVWSPMMPNVTQHENMTYRMFNIITAVYLNYELNMG